MPIPQSSAPIAVDALFRAHAAFIARFLRRLGVPAADLDDAVQEVFVVAHRKGGYVPGPAQPRTWLSAIALFIAQARRRARAAREQAASPEIEAAAAGELDQGASLDARRGLLRVQRALDTLPFEQRAAFVLFEIEGESCETIAELLQVPVGTVYSRLHHARQRFLRSHRALLSAGGEARAPRCAGGER